VLLLPRQTQLNTHARVPQKLRTAEAVEAEVDLEFIAG
jgi:hypothetical protein